MKVNTSAQLLNLQVSNTALGYQSKFLFHFILLLLFPKPLHPSVSEQSSLFVQHDPKLDQFTVVLCKVKTIQCHYYCKPSIPSKSLSDGYYNMCDRTQLLPPPRPVLFLCWEGDGRHLLAHLFTLQTRPKLVAFPAVFQKQVIK